MLRARTASPEEQRRTQTCQGPSSSSYYSARGGGGGICISDVANCLSLPCALLCRPGSLTDMHTITYYTVSTEAPTRGPGFQRARGSHTQTMSRCKVPHAENQNRRGTRVVMWPGWVRANLSEEVTFKMSPE